MSTLFKRRPIQVPMVDWLLEHERCNLFADVGTGKTSGCLLAGEILRDMGELNYPTLILAPARVAKDTWTDEQEKWDQFKDLDIIPIVGTPAQRLKKLKLDRPYFTSSYENAPWLVEQWLGRWPYGRLIADESDRLKGFRLNKGGSRARSIGNIAHTYVKHWINMTGTPSAEGLKDLWGQNWYVDRGARLGRTHGAFKERWFRESFNGFDMEPQPWAEKQIHDAIRDVSLTLDPRDFYDIKDPIQNTVEVTLPPKARKIYDKLEAEMFVKLSEDSQIVARTAAALTNKCLQMANGAVYTDYPNWEEMHDEKIEALKSIQGSAGGAPLLVAYAFKSDKARLLRAFKGSVDLSEDAGLLAFKAGRVQIGIAHPASMGHGIDGLHHVCNRLVFFGHQWRLGLRLQMVGRIGPMRQMQGGYDRPVFVTDIVAKKTVDVDCVLAHARKMTVQTALLEAMKRRSA